jgi:hypothetical protein
MHELMPTDRLRGDRRLFMSAPASDIRKTAALLMPAMSAAWLLVAGAHAQDQLPANNPYAAIVKRNAFGLAPPPEPADQPAAEPAPKITPNGIMTIFGKPQVLFKVTPTDPGSSAKEKTYILDIGQQEDGIAVVDIDDVAGDITFNNHGTIQELPLKTLPDSGAVTPRRRPIRGFIPPS